MDDSAGEFGWVKTASRWIARLSSIVMVGLVLLILIGQV